MVNLCPFNPRNVLRAYGVVAILSGAPMIIAPAFMAAAFFSKRESPPPKEDKALHVLVRSCGSDLIGIGLHSLLAVPGKASVLAALGTEATNLCINLGNIITDEYNKAGVNVRKLLPYMFFNVLFIAFQVTAMCHDEKSDSDDTEQSDRKD